MCGKKSWLKSKPCQKTTKPENMVKKSYGSRKL